MRLDIKIDDYKRNIHLVVEGHVTYMPQVITYSSIVTREIVSISLAMAMLHDLAVKKAYELNAYMMAPNEK